MLFRSELIVKTWDTWMYYHRGTYYLYYLTSGTAPGDGFGVATSVDGIRWHDYGRVLGPSDKMIRYLGTGSVWRAADAAETERFLCNYSEWRKEGDHAVQRVLFATSDDLVTWHKLGDRHAFTIDERFYQKIKPDAHGPWEWPRWDGICVMPRPEGGYYGYWTATPKDTLGFGFGESDDGLHWRALAPPRVAWGDPPEMYFIEVGGVHAFEGRIYCMVGDYADINCGMFTLVADSPAGPFRPAARNFSLLPNQSKMHTYFTRFLDTPDGVLVNHHTLAEGQFSDDDFVVYFAPLKQARIIEGGLYLAWWPGNDALKAIEVPVSQGSEEDLEVTMDTGIVLEGAMALPGSLFIGTGEDAGVRIRVSPEGVTEMGPGSREGASFKCDERVDRALAFGLRSRFRLLLRHTMIEFYLEDILIQCYTMDNPADGRIALEGASDLRLWRWSP
ncbi:MAG: hypothetical protein ACP5HS_05065 [Anaerolineae bacterium]